MRKESAWQDEAAECNSAGLCVELIDEMCFKTMELIFAKSILN